MLADSVTAAIREAISAGEFQPGEQLSEVRIAERFECSRNTLREAFADLAATLLVERIPHRGVFIATPDRAYVRDLYLARAAIEPSAARWGTFPDPHALVDLTVSARPLAEAGKHQAVSSINQRFHRALVAGLESTTMDRLMADLLARMRLAFLLVIPRYPLLHADHVEENVTLAQLIADGKREEAAAFSRDSLMRSLEAINRYL